MTEVIVHCVVEKKHSVSRIFVGFSVNVLVGVVLSCDSMKKHGSVCKIIVECGNISKVAMILCVFVGKMPFSVKNVHGAQC